jgi:hypothetical protein
MVSTSRVLPRPFIEPKSFFEVGIGNEQIQFKPEWRKSFEPFDRAPRKEAA